MEMHKVDHEQTGSLGKLVQDYITGAGQVRPFYTYSPDKPGVLEAAAAVDFTADKRRMLAEALRHRYDGIKVTEAVVNNLELVARDNTYTITTGHQLSLFTGPLYFIYKICTVIKIAAELDREGRGSFIPVFWLASEDHDFAEISTVIVGTEAVFLLEYGSGIFIFTNNGSQ